MQDDYPIYSNLWQPEAFFAALSISVALAAAVIYRSRVSVVSFGVLWYFGGHLIESTTVPLELYFEHRNYLPIMGPIFSLVVVGHFLVKSSSKFMQMVAGIFAAVIISISSMINMGYASEWGDQLRLISIWPQSTNLCTRSAQQCSCFGKNRAPK